MEKRKVEKSATLILGVVVICLSFVRIDSHIVGIYPNCHLLGRVLYPLFHANLLHATLNIWCLLSLVFMYNIRTWRLLLSYVISATVPIGCIASLWGGSQLPTIGLSGVVFVLFGSISFEVSRKWYYQMWMVAYIVIGFFNQGVNAWLHLYCYIIGLVIALLNKPIKIDR
ncbi:MAG: rhomboid family intramembrane serine protease [Rikenellaceae bacterium]